MNTYFVSPHAGQQPPKQPQIIARRGEWLAQQGLQLCKADVSLAKVAGKMLVRFGGPGYVFGDWNHLPLPRECFDHVELFYRPSSKRYVLISQPYDMTTEHFAALQAGLMPLGMTASLSWDGWHFPAACPLVVISPAT